MIEQRLKLHLQLFNLWRMVSIKERPTAKYSLATLVVHALRSIAAIKYGSSRTSNSCISLLNVPHHSCNTRCSVIGENKHSEYPKRGVSTSATRCYRLITDLSVRYQAEIGRDTCIRNSLSNWTPLLFLELYASCR